jgi:4-hydroxy 2-oxovalerate aldolase
VRARHGQHKAARKISYWIKEKRFMDDANLRLIDVTLRDGGYRNNFDFSMKYVLEHARDIQESGCEYIEVGYRNGSVVPSPNMGLTGHGSNEYIRALKKELPDIKLVVIAHAANITDKDVEEMADAGVSMLRLCVNTKNVDETLRYARLAKECGMEVSCNVVRVSSIDLPTLGALVAKLDVHRNVIDVIYFADSNGNLTPKSVREIAEEFKRNTSVAIGFHAHDNIGLAMSNAIAAVESGVCFIDASLLGMGKGIGNLKLEKWIAYQLRKGNKRYSLVSILRAAARLRSSSSYTEDMGDYAADVLCGLYNYSFTDRHKAESILAGAVPA